jgi:HAD superfamily hydrolase (TIGR01549 family)
MSVVTKIRPRDHTNRRVVALLFDLGDTLIVEGTEVKDVKGTTLQAELIPGMAEALRWFKTRSYGLALVADSRPNTPVNVLRQHKLYHLFDYLAISEVVGVEKPAPSIFQVALEALGIQESDYDRVAMVGNNLERDIVGANRLGLISFFFIGTIVVAASRGQSKRNRDTRSPRLRNWSLWSRAWIAMFVVCRLQRTCQCQMRSKSASLALVARSSQRG